VVGPSLAAAAADAVDFGGRRAVCRAPLCGAVLAGAPHEAPMLLHLRKTHVIGDVPDAVAAELGLAGCRRCDSPYPAARPRHGSSPLEAHQRQCKVNPRRHLHPRPPPAPAAARPAQSASPSPGDVAAAPPTPPTSTPTLFAVDRAAWARARRAFLGAVAPTADG